MSKHADLIKYIRLMEREEAAMKKASARAVQPGQSHGAMMKAHETARCCAIELRRFKDQAHALAVGLGIADHRGDAAYQPGTAPTGFGQDFEHTKPAPTAVDRQMDELMVLGQIRAVVGDPHGTLMHDELVDLITACFSGATP